MYMHSFTLLRAGETELLYNEFQASVFLALSYAINNVLMNRGEGEGRQGEKCTMKGVYQREIAQQVDSFCSTLFSSQF